MAFKNNAPTEHPYKRITRELKEESLKNVLYFFGKEEFLIDWAIQSIVKQFVNEACMELDYSKLDGKTAMWQDIRNNCETPSMMSKKRVIHLTEFKLLEGGKVKGFQEEEEKQMVEYVKTFPESCILILTGMPNQGPDRRKRLYKAIAEVGGIYDFCTLDETHLKAFIEKRLRVMGKTIRTSVLTEFIHLSGYYDKDTDYTLYNVTNDVKKMIAHCDGEEITPLDVKNTVVGNIDTNIFAMIEALSKNRKDLAFQLLHNQLISGESEYLLLSLICSQFELMLAVKEMKENAMTLAEMKKQLGVHEFRIKRAAVFSEAYSKTHLKSVLQKAFDVDKNIKTGRLEPSLALEMFIAEI